MKRIVSAAGLLLALAACAPERGKTVALVDPRASAPAAPPILGPERQTLDQMLARARERFAAADLDGDGKVTTEELEQARADRDPEGPRRGAGARLMRADTDTDGEITLADIETHTRERFARLDTDKDGEVSRAELAAGLRAAR